MLSPLLLGNVLGSKVRFIVDQQGPQNYLKMDFEVAWQTTSKSPSLGWESCEALQPVADIRVVWEKVLTPLLESRLVCATNWIGIAGEICQSCYMLHMKSIHVKIAHVVAKVSPKMTFRIHMFNLSNGLVTFQAQRKLGFVNQSTLSVWELTDLTCPRDNSWTLHPWFTIT